MKAMNALKAQKIVADWNAKYPIGTHVNCRKDDGSIMNTHTRSEAWAICHVPVVMVRGIVGGYALSRVTPV